MNKFKSFLIALGLIVSSASYQIKASNPAQKQLERSLNNRESPSQEEFEALSRRLDAFKFYIIFEGNKAILTATARENSRLKWLLFLEDRTSENAKNLRKTNSTVLDIIKDSRDKAENDRNAITGLNSLFTDKTEKNKSEIISLKSVGIGLLAGVAVHRNTNLSNLKSSAIGGTISLIASYHYSQLGTELLKDAALSFGLNFFINRFILPKNEKEATANQKTLPKQDPAS